MTHRPEITIREIESIEAWMLHEICRDNPRLPPADLRIRMGVRLGLRQPTHLTGSFRLTNTGGNAATINLINVIFYVGWPLPQINPCFDHVLPVHVPPIGAGETTRLDIPAIEFTIADFLRLGTQETVVHVIGKIVYQDEYGNGRRTGFARRLNVETGRFERRRDEDYEYSD
jgi:hypothetical protein